MKKLRHTRRGRPPVVPPRDELRMVRDYKGLKSVKAVAEKWNCHIDTARAILRRHGVETRGRMATIEGHPLLGTGSDGDVGKVLGVSHDTVARARRKAGIKPFNYTKKEQG